MVQEKEVKGGTEALALNGSLTNVATSFTSKTTPTANWPTGAAFPFVVTIGRNTATEEQILCTSRSGSTFNVTTRGYGNTTAVAHSDNEAVEHTVDAVLLTEAIHAAANTTGLITSAEDILVGTGLGTLKRLAKGSNGQLLQVVAGAVAYGALPAGSVVAGVVGVGGISASNQFAAGVVDTAALGALAVTDAKVATGIALTKLATIADQRILGNVSGGTAAAIALTQAQMKTFLASVAADISDFNTAVRTNRLDQMAAPTADVSMNTHKITGVVNPASAQDAATKNYVDAALPLTSTSSFVPTIRQNGSTLSTQATTTYYYVRNGTVVTINFFITIGGAGGGQPAGSKIDISIPIAYIATGEGVAGGCRWSDGSSATRVGGLILDGASSTRVWCDFSTLIQSPVLAQGHSLSGTCSYLVA